MLLIVVQPANAHISMCCGKCGGNMPLNIPGAGSTKALAYQTRCGACHGLPHPHRHTFAHWGHLLALMEVRIKGCGMDPLNADDRDAILAYLKNNARSD